MWVCIKGVVTHRAQGAIEAMLSPNAMVVRDGEQQVRVGVY